MKTSETKGANGILFSGILLALGVFASIAGPTAGHPYRFLPGAGLTVLALYGVWVYRRAITWDAISRGLYAWPLIFGGMLVLSAIDPRYHFDDQLLLSCGSILLGVGIVMWCLFRK